MNFHLSLNNDDTLVDVSNCIEDLIRRGSLAINVTINSTEISENWNLFQKNFFIADLLGINSFFIFGELEKKWKLKVADLVAESIFNAFPSIVFPESDKEDFSFPQRVENVIEKDLEAELTDELRTIIVWNGNTALEPETVVNLKFENQIITGNIVQIQKVINPNFQGSEFGINRLDSGEIGTIKLQLNSTIERFYYEDNQSKGIFVLIDDTSKQLGFGITIK